MNTFECIRARRSVRAFLPAPVEPEKLDAIAQAALYAPVGMRAYETMHLTVVTDKAVLDRFTAMAREQAGDAQADPIHGAPTLIVVSVSRPEPVPFANAACMIENMLLARPSLHTDFGSFLEFETLTLCPYDLRAVDASLLSAEEKQWVNRYHATVCRELLPLLDDEADRRWLEQATRTL